VPAAPSSNCSASSSPLAVLVSDTVLFSYVHLRAHHGGYGWTPEAARDAVIGLVTNGYLPR